MENNKKSVWKKVLLGLLAVLLLSGACASFYYIGTVVGMTEAHKALNESSDNGSSPITDES